MADHDCATKLCARCGQQKPLSEFNKCKDSADRLQYKCRACQKELRREWYLKNREGEIQKSKDWAKQNPEKAREKDRRRNKANPGRTAAQSKRWREENRQKYNEQKRAWKIANPEKVRAQARAAYAKNPERELAKAHSRRVKSPETGTVFTRKDVARILLLQRGKCACCASSLGARFHRDHIIPLALGGTNDHLNIQLLCAPCNRKKSAKHPVDFMQENGFLL